MADTRTQILEIAERLIRSGGYNHCSFRDIAAEIGIKSASVHHHFPAKQDLAAAVARRYAENFLARLNLEPLPSSTPELIKRYCGVFRNAFASDGRGCLCGILSNESGLLPDSVQREVSAFIDANVTWLEHALTVGSQASPPAMGNRARLIYSALQGAMAVAVLRKDADWLEEVVLELAP